MFNKILCNVLCQIQQVQDFFISPRFDCNAKVSLFSADSNVSHIILSDSEKTETHFNNVFSCYII